MNPDYWQKQTVDKPLFPDLIWSRPENKSLAGKLLIIGGNPHSFAAPANAFNEATKAGIGSCRLLLPDSLEKTVGINLPSGQYAPSTPSGSFSRQALAEALSESNWANGVLLTGDFGRNSETAVFLEQFINKYKGLLTLSGDSLDYFIKSPEALLNRDDTLLVVSFNQLQKIATAIHFSEAFTHNMGLVQLVQTLHNFTKQHKPAITVIHSDNVVVALNGKVISTKIKSNKPSEVSLAARSIVWWTQNSSRPLESITSAIL